MKTPDPKAGCLRTKSRALSSGGEGSQNPLELMGRVRCTQRRRMMHNTHHEPSEYQAFYTDFIESSPDPVKWSHHVRCQRRQKFRRLGVVQNHGISLHGPLGGAGAGQIIRVSQDAGRTNLTTERDWGGERMHLPTSLVKLGLWPLCASLSMSAFLIKSLLFKISLACLQKT